MVYMSQYLGWDVIWHVNWGHDFPAHNGRRCLGSRFVFIMSDQSQSAVLVNFPNTVPARHVADVWWCGTLLWDGVYRQFNYVLATVWHWRLTIVCTMQHIIPTLGGNKLFLKHIQRKHIVKRRLHVWSQAGAGDRELCIQMDICQPGTELTNFYFSFTVIVLPKTAFGSGYSYSTKVIFTAKFTTEKLVSQNMKVLYQLKSPCSSY